MTCPINSYFPDDINIFYDKTQNYYDKYDKCNAIMSDNLIVDQSSVREVKTISCNAIKQNSKLHVYTLKNPSNINEISCPLGGWCNNNVNQQLLNIGIKNNEITSDFELTSFNNKSIKISDLCLDDVEIPQDSTSEQPKGFMLGWMQREVPQPEVPPPEVPQLEVPSPEEVYQLKKYTYDNSRIGS